MLAQAGVTARPEFAARTFRSLAVREKQGAKGNQRYHTALAPNLWGQFLKKS